ncbi:hypothetical protein QBC39DRAFT_100716 [Podospora conica]|nr:hypothetical protein QBC39DRAFT_100716 [Schizothecium conicum]
MHTRVVSQMRSYWDLRQLSDCQVKCGDRAWELHKLVICTRSKFFQKALCGGFMESKTSEVILADHDPKHVELALRCLYSGDILELEETMAVVDNEMTAYQVCMKIYLIGDFLDSDVICDSALDGMDYNNKLRLSGLLREDQQRQCLSGFQDSFLDFAKVAYSHPKRSGRGSIYPLPESVRMSLGPRDLTTPFIQFLLAAKPFLWSPTYPDLIKALEEVPDLLAGMLITFAWVEPTINPHSAWELTLENMFEDT